VNGRRPLVAAAVFLAHGALGVLSLAPGVGFGDSGELVASAATLGVAHAPGYPLHSLGAHLVGTLVPLAGWAWRTNLFSALCAAGAAAVLVDALLLLGLGLVPALVGALSLTLSPPWLRSALGAEVFSLHWLLAAACVWTLCRFRERAFDERPMALLGLLLGLGGANHQTLALAVPALLAAAWTWARPAPVRAWRGLAFLTGFALLGLAAYAYLPLRARASPPLDWGHPVDLPRFLHVLLRRDYGSFALTVEGAQGGRLGGAAAQLGRWLGEAVRGFGPGGLLLALLGGWALSRAKERRPELLLAGLLALFCGPGFLILGNPPFDALTTGALERFQPLSWLALALLAARGTELLGARLPSAALTALLLLPCGRAFAAAGGWSGRGDYAAHDYGRNLLRSLPRRAALFMDGGDDTFYTLAAAVYGEGLRGDLALHDRGGLVFRGAYGPDFRRLPRAQKERRRVEVEERMALERPVFYSTLRDEIVPGRALALAGILRRLEPSGSAAFETPQGPALWEAYALRFDEAKARAHYRYRALVPLYPLMEASAFAARGRRPEALLLLRSALRLGPDVLWLGPSVSRAAQWAGWLAGEAGDWPAAERAYRLALDAAPGDGEAGANLAVAFEKQGRFEDAERAYREAVAKTPTPAAWHNLAALYWGRGRWAESADAFERALALDPGDAKLRAWRDEAVRRSRR
jgi:tetratricopeptide (TPR) repeat protein